MNTPLNRVTPGSIFRRRLHAAKVTRKEEATETVGKKKGKTGRISTSTVVRGWRHEPETDLRYQS